MAAPGNRFSTPDGLKDRFILSEEELAALDNRFPTQEALQAETERALKAYTTESALLKISVKAAKLPQVACPACLVPQVQGTRCPTRGVYH